MKEETWSFERALLFGDGDLTRSKLKEATCRLHRGAHRAEAGVRPKVSRSISDDSSGSLHPRIRPRGDADVRISTIVAQSHVVTREVLTNERRLKEERLLH